MKKFMIITDMEGMAGVTSWDDVTLGSPEHERYRAMLTLNVCNVCEVLKDIYGSDTRIIVKDCHWTGRNILHEDLPSGVSLVSGKITDRPIVLEQLDETFTGVLLLNMHAPSPTLGNPLAHTENDDKYISFELNGRLSSEVEFYAYEAALVKVPIRLITGDDYICKEAIKRGYTRNTVSTKKSYGGSVESRSIDDIESEIRTALENHSLLFNPIAELPSSFKLEVTYTSVVDAYHAAFFPGAKLIAPNKVVIENDDYYEIRRAMMFI